MMTYHADLPPYLRRREASGYLKRHWGLAYASGTLAKLACIGGGPTYAKAGRWPMYRPDDLDAWAISRFQPPAGGR